MNTNLEKSRQLFEEGLTLLKKSNFSEAVIKFNEALLLAPDRISILVNLSAGLIELGRWSECEKICNKILSIEPENYDAILNLGICLSHKQNNLKALELFNQAIFLNPHLDSAWVNKGIIMQTLDNYEEAEKCFNKAISLNPLSQEALVGKGSLYVESKDYKKALEAFDRALELNSLNSLAKWNKALLLIRLGNFAEGWRLYESRWEIAGIRESKKHSDIQLWLGGKDIRNKSILIYAEQGYGDTIQFCRYLPLIEKLGATVIFEVPKPLLKLMKFLSPSILVIENKATNFNQINTSADFQCPIMSLPLAFKTSLSTIPNSIPYLSTDVSNSTNWNKKLSELSSANRTGSHFRIGIAWSGSGHYAGKLNNRRDIALQDVIETLNPFILQGVEVHSLQINPSANDLRMFSASRIFSHHNSIHDFSDTACLIEELDVIISIDTAIAHLAGALGKNTWILIPNPSDFMVLIDQQTHPWYPNSILFHQETPNDWKIPLKKISNKLKNLLNQRATNAV